MRDYTGAMREHWEHVYQSKQPNEVSWFRPHLETSLELIENAAQGNKAAAILDAGGGASTLVDDLVERGYRNITVLDISQSALDVAKARLRQVPEITWLRQDVTSPDLPSNAYDVWHDRAVFHFLTEKAQRDAYVRNLMATLKQHGHVILSTFGIAGPKKCSGLDAMRYDAASLQRELGPRFQLVEAREEMHGTPFGTIQQFLYCHFVLGD